MYMSYVIYYEIYTPGGRLSKLKVSLWSDLSLNPKNSKTNWILSKNSIQIVTRTDEDGTVFCNETKTSVAGLYLVYIVLAYPWWLR